jgi:uncharacterized damage-inducible protein DinB
MLCCLICFGTLILGAADTASPQKKFVQDFEKHWDTAKQLTLAVADAMPAENYSFKPVPEEMSFGEQMDHITSSVYAYCAFVADSKSPYEKPAQIEKADVLKKMGESFDYCSDVVRRVPDGGLDQARTRGKTQVDSREILFALLIHTSHHRGQAEVYLRLKGITPPPYKW